MKIIFFCTALVGLVYLVLQSNAGESWLKLVNSEARVLEQETTTSGVANANQRVPEREDVKISLSEHAKQLGAENESIALLKQEFETLKQTSASRIDALRQQNQELQSAYKQLEQSIASLSNQATKASDIKSIATSDNVNADQNMFDDKKFENKKQQLARSDESEREFTIALNELASSGSLSQQASNTNNEALAKRNLANQQQAKLQDVINRMELASLDLLSR